MPATAAAATSSQIHRDAADGSIDGSYSMAELRAADRTVGAELREYYGWDDAYREYVRGMGSLPTASPDEARAPIPAREAGASEVEKPSPSETATSGPRSSSAPVRAGRLATTAAEVVEPSAAGAAGEAVPADPAGSPAREAEPLALDDGSTGFPFVLLLLAIPLLVLMVGMWRSMRQRRGGARERTRDRAASSG